MNNTERTNRVNNLNILKKKNGKELLNICNELIHDKIYVRKEFEIVKIKEDGLWNMDPFKNRSWRFWVNCLIMCEYLLDGYEESSDDRYLKKALDIIFNWYEDSALSRNITDMTWHDHSTALRTLILSRVFEVIGNLKSYEHNIQKLEEIIEQHCCKLIDDDFYMKKHNHGLDQDIALYIACSLVNTMKNADQWKRKAKKRFWIQIDNLFAYDGSYLEHSLSYSYSCTTRLIMFMNFMKCCGDYDYKKIENTINQQMRFLTYMCQPNGDLPPIGDGEFMSLSYEDFKMNNNYIEQVKFLETKGKEGNEPNEIDAIFPMGEYCVLRNTWEYSHETVQLIFNSSFHSRVHKHHDDLSINLFAHGQPILIDAGKFNYNYDDVERKYVVSRVAHNTVCVDNKNTNISRINIGKSGISNYYFSNNISIVSGIQCLYEGVIHQRVVIYLKQYDFIVLDLMKGYKNHKFEQIFNFNPNIKCLNIDNDIIGKINGECKINLTSLINKYSIETELHYGEEKPLRGWCTKGYGELQPIWAGSFIQKGKEAKFATHISLDNHSSITNFTWDKDIIGFGHKRDKYKLFLGKDDLYLLVNNKFMETINITSTTLKYAVKYNEEYELRERYLQERTRRLELQEKLESVLGKVHIESLKCDEIFPQEKGCVVTWVCEAIGNELEYAYYIYKNDEIFIKFAYETTNEFKFKFTEEGTYKIKVFVKNNKQIKKSFNSESFHIVK